MIKISEKEKYIFKILAQATEELGMEAHIIGGYVRDKILNRQSKDLDIVCEGDGIKLAKKVGQLLDSKSKVTVFKRFGTAMIKSKGFELEFVGARKESYNFNSRKPDVEPGTFQDDLERRDFTINTLYIDINQNDFTKITDIFGGIDHIKQKLIITPLNPDITFSDDPLRMMRAIRFATQLGFNIDKATFEAIKRNKDRIKIVSIERITDELQKIIEATKPSYGFRLLFDSGLLHHIFPEFVNLAGVDKINNISHKDNFYHTIEVLDNIANQSDDIWLRWAAILHDIGKPITKRFNEKEGWTFHGHEMVGAKMTFSIFKKMRLPLDHKMKYVQKLVKLHLRPMALVKEEVTDSAIRRLLFEAGSDIDDLMTLAKADITSKNENKIKTFLENYNQVILKIKEVEEKDRLRNWQPPVSGDEIMNLLGLPPSKEVGIIKTEIREAILDGKIHNDKSDALNYMKKIAAKMNLHTESTIELSNSDVFAIYRLPNTSDQIIIRQKDNKLNLFNSKSLRQKGFVFYPFDNRQSIPFFIKADEILVNKKFTFTSKDSGESIDISRDNYLVKAKEFISDTKKRFNKIVLSRTKTISKPSNDLYPLFSKMDEKYKNAMIFLVHHPDVGTWMGATPELLLHTKDNNAETMALAGTQFIKNLDNIVWEEKERREQNAVMVHIEDCFKKQNIEYKKNKPHTKIAAKNDSGILIHLATDYSFKPKNDLFKIISDLHPTPAVSGLPKLDAIEYIIENEGYNREYYTGFLGPTNICCMKSTDLYVNLRSMKVYNDKYVLYLGGGLNSGSIAEKEWVETENKAKTIEELL